MRQRLAFNILLDELALEIELKALTPLQAAADPGVARVEQAIPSHRISFLEQRAILGAAGIEMV